MNASYEHAQPGGLRVDTQVYVAGVVWMCFCFGHPPPTDSFGRRRPSRQDARVELQEKGTLTSELRARRSRNAAKFMSSAGANA